MRSTRAGSPHAAVDKTYELPLKSLRPMPGKYVVHELSTLASSSINLSKLWILASRLSRWCRAIASRVMGSFGLPKASRVRLTVYNLQGRQVAVLVDGMRTAGVHRAAFDGGLLASGIYLIHMEAEGFNQTQKMVLVK